MTARTVLLPGSPEIELLLRPSAGARRFSLRVSRLDGRVTLSFPARAPVAEALAFARGQADWIRRALATHEPTVAPVGAGSVLPVEGQALTITPAPVRAVRVEGGALLVPPDPARAGLRVEAFLRHAARDRLALACDRYAAALGRGYRGLTLRDTRSRWGSCSPAGALMFSWRLVMAPPAVLDYVAAHEVAHLAEMNHSPRFWAVVAGLLPGYAAPRRWLKVEGAALHRYRFRAGEGS